MLKTPGVNQQANSASVKGRLRTLTVELEVLISILKGMEKSLYYDIQLYFLSFALRQSYKNYQFSGGWDRNQNLLRSALQLCPPNHRLTFTLLHDLGAVIVARHMRLGNSVETAELNGALPILRKLILLMPSNDPNLLGTATILARGFYWRYTRLKNQDDVENAIKYFELVMKIRPSEKNVELSIAYHSLAMAHLSRLGTTIDISPAVNNLRQCRRFLPHNHPFYPEADKLLYDCLTIRISRSEGTADIEEAIRLQAEIFNRHPAGDPERSTLLAEFGTYCSIFYSRSQELSHLDLSIQYNTQALIELQNDRLRERVDLLVSLVSAHDTRFERSNLVKDLDAGMAYAAELLELCPPGHPYRIDCLSVTWLIYQGRYRHSRDLQDLQTALEHSRARLDLLPPDDANPVPLHNVAHLLIELNQQRTLTLSEINESIRLSSKATTLARSSDHLKLSNIIGTLGIGLRTRYQHTGDITDLDRAIECFREENMMLNSKPMKENIRSLCQLSDTLRLRYQVFWHNDDLKEAASCIKKVLSFGPTALLDDPGVLNCVAAFFQLGSGNTPLKYVDGLSTGVKLLNKSLSICPETHPSRHMLLSNASWLLLHRLRQTGDLEDAKVAITYLREAVALSAQPQYVYILACAIMQRAIILRSTADLEEAITAYHRAEESTSEHHPVQGYIAHGLAKAYAIRNRASDHQKSFSYFERATNHLSGSLLDRLVVGGLWASKARREGHNSVIRAYSAAISLAEHLVMTSHSMDAQHQRLTRIEESLPSQAACCAIDEGELETAVELLEQGRTLLWSQVGRYRSPLDQLDSVNPSLAEEFRQLSHQLDQFVVTPTAISDRDNSMYRVQSRQWKEMVERIRAEDGLHDFLKPIPFATLRQAAAKGPVVVINIERISSDALVIQDTCSPTLVELPQATPDVISSLAVELKTALALDGDGAYKTKAAKITRILRSLWEIIVRPIVEVLKGSCGLREGSRVWWCPTSTLWSLPLHAAGPYTAGERNLPDIFVSSYTPTLSALLRSIGDKLRQPAGVSPNMLVVGQVQTPGQVTLVNVLEEMRQVQETAPKATFLDGEACVCEAILSGLRDCSWAHFACHGKQDLVRPFDSHFILHDKPLHLLDIIKTGLPNAEFAFLSACHSAAGDQRTPNESIHLASGLQFAGFKSVVGTMWKMADEDGPVVAKEFYKYMFRNPGMADSEDGAVALNRATKVLRKMKVPVDRWINFVHIGA